MSQVDPAQVGDPISRSRGDARAYAQKCFRDAVAYADRAESPQVALEHAFVGRLSLVRVEDVPASIRAEYDGWLQAVIGAHAGAHDASALLDDLRNMAITIRALANEIHPLELPGV